MAAETQETAAFRSQPKFISHKAEWRLCRLCATKPFPAQHLDPSRDNEAYSSARSHQVCAVNPSWILRLARRPCRENSKPPRREIRPLLAWGVFASEVELSESSVRWIRLGSHWSRASLDIAVVYSGCSLFDEYLWRFDGGTTRLNIWSNNKMGVFLLYTLGLRKSVLK